MLAYGEQVHSSVTVPAKDALLNECAMEKQSSPSMLLPFPIVNDMGESLSLSSEIQGASCPSCSPFCEVPDSSMCLTQSENGSPLSPPDTRVA